MPVSRTHMLLPNLRLSSSRLPVVWPCQLPRPVKLSFTRGNLLTTGSTVIINTEAALGASVLIRMLSGSNSRIFFAGSQKHETNQKKMFILHSLYTLDLVALLLYVVLVVCYPCYISILSRVYPFKVFIPVYNLSLRMYTVVCNLLYAHSSNLYTF